ncbi:putative enzyme [Mesorhizobium sp. ORS 3324]|nr:putative enzyme [Mesorhizobium sp. ORS 3324]
MFVDTSVVVAILAGEDDAAEWSSKIEKSPRRITSPLVMLEAAMRLSSLLAVEPIVAETAIEAFLREAEIEVVPIESGDAKLAIRAFSDYGKGRCHPAQLNLADCLSYASAKSRGMALLYKGNDFSHTGLA